MLVIIIKKVVNSRFVDYDATKMCSVGNKITLPDGKTYKVILINGSKVTLEEV